MCLTAPLQKINRLESLKNGSALAYARALYYVWGDTSFLLRVIPEKLVLSDLFELLHGVVAQNEKSPALVRLFTILVAESIREDHPSHQYFIDRYRRGRELYLQQLKTIEGVQAHPEVDLGMLASLFMAVMDGLQIQWLLDPDQVNMGETFELFMDILRTTLES